MEIRGEITLFSRANDKLINFVDNDSETTFLRIIDKVTESFNNDYHSMKYKLSLLDEEGIYQTGVFMKNVGKDGIECLKDDFYWLFEN